MHRSLFSSASHPHDTNDPSPLISQRQLCGKKPVQSPLLIVKELEPIDDRLSSAKHTLVVFAIGPRDLGMQELFIGGTNQLRLIAGTTSCARGSIRRHESALLVLDKDECIWREFEHSQHISRIRNAAEKHGLG
nr:hypothetical protein [Stieleria maiorica]